MQVRTFTTQEVIKFSGNHYDRQISLTISGDSYLTIESRVNGGWQLVDTLYYSGTHPLFASPNTVRFTPTGSVIYEIPLDAGEMS